MAKLDRITSDPAILGGQPTIRGMRLSVRRVVGALALYPNWDDLRAEYPELEPEDIRQALEFAANNLDDKVIPLETACNASCSIRDYRAPPGSFSQLRIGMPYTSVMSG